jgi:threonine dehydrogenase-like Zn-dependent dehydrogenase
MWAASGREFYRPAEAVNGMARDPAAPGWFVVRAVRPCRPPARGAPGRPGEELFFSGVHLHGGPAPVRRFLPELIDLICSRTIDPGKVFDLALPLEQAAEGYPAMDERRAVNTLLRP